MGENNSNKGKNNKNEIWYGWIPKLSHEMIIRVETENGYDENKTFDEVTEKDLRRVFKDKYMLLSDKRIDNLLKKKHTVKFSYHKIISSCECCKEKVWSVTVEIKRKNNKGLIKGTANIHKSGLVRYKILYNKVKKEHSTIHKIIKIIKNVRDRFHLYYSEEEHSTIHKIIKNVRDRFHLYYSEEEHSINKAQDIHKIVRDHLHFHLYHSSDMPLPPVKVDRKCDEDLAKEKILRKFLDAFIMYKREVGRVKLPNEEKNLSRALGEIIYANSALDKFSERKYLFSWDDVPKNNTELIKFLKDELKIEQVENAEIKKSDETINVVDKDSNANIVTIKLNEAEKKINLEIFEGKMRKTYEYILKEENGKLNIYKEKNYEEFKKSFENFNRSFEMLLQRAKDRRNILLQHISFVFSSTIAVLAINQFLIYLPNFFKFFNKEIISGMMALSFLSWFFIVLYLGIKAYKLRKAQK